jgi:hypothetical protein
MRAASLVAFATVVLASACLGAGCEKKEPQPSTYFDRSIAPILQTSCVRTNTGAGCHVADARGNAFGNLDLSTYAGVDRRRDLLIDYGPYLQPSLLVKNVAPYTLPLVLWDGTKIAVTTDIKHTGGPILNTTDSAYLTLRRWIENGATVNNTGVALPYVPNTPCSGAVPSVPGFDPTQDPTAADFSTFAQLINPLLRQSCAAGNCHGTQVNTLYLTCGETPAEVRYNYFAAVDYLAASAEQSEIARRPLATSQGGSFHEGGPIFTTVNDPGYVQILAWGNAHGPPPATGLSPAFMFFARRVQPVLVKKGCAMAQCHSAVMFHDYRLRGGSAGSFSLAATRRNYDLTVAQMSFESEDVGASRLVRKNLYRPEVCPGSAGLTHRGGPLFEDFANAAGTCASIDYGAACDEAAYDYDNASLDTIKPYCVIREWHRRERADRGLSSLSGIVYIKRPIPAAPDRPQDFDVFAGGASLHLVGATAMARGPIQLGTDSVVDLSTCSPTLGSAPDVRRPAVSWDGQSIAFAARATANDPLGIYVVHVDGTGCSRQPDIAKHDPTGNGLLEHDFDPAFSPPGPDGIERIVFASTRGNLDGAAFDYAGPQRTPEDSTKANANLYVLEPDPANPQARRVRQLTWQLNLERMPSFMQDGRIIFTAEKREPGFYQLALRRQNLDGSDYHPLYAQRGSIGYNQAASVVELADKNFAAIFSNRGAVHGAGSLIVFNRSIGVDFSSTNAADYPVDPTVIDGGSASAPESSFFLHSLRVVGSDGSYTTPAALPGSQMLVSFGAGDPASFGGDYDLYVLDPVSGQKTKLLGNTGTAEVEAAAVYARAPKGIFVARGDEPNGHAYTIAGESAADVTVLDMPVLASLLFQNTPTGRVVESDLRSVDLYEDLPPDVTSFPSSCGGFLACDAYGQVYVRRRLLGTVPVRSDGSAHFRIPGGLPLVLHLPDDAESRQRNLPRWQREEMTFVPGEHARQSFPAAFFDELCAGCHGSISGRPVDFAVRPDFLTQASQVTGVLAAPIDLSGPPNTRGTVIGP